MKTGIELISEERQRQIQVEGYDSNHDDDPYHDAGELASVAACYASPELIYALDDNGRLVANALLPKERRIRNLVKAGALIAAEIDRLQRLT